jgi:hypothetical protein
MALSNYKAATREFPLGDGSFAVKGLSLVDITHLIRHHLPDLEALVDIATQALNGRKELTEGDVDLLAIALAEHAPGFVGNLIASAEVGGAKDQASAEGAMAMPFPLQIEVLLTIADLTFKEVGGVKKAVERVAALMKNDRIAALLKKTVS